MKVVAISDLHGSLPSIPECELVCICGDVSPLDIQANHRKMRKWLKNEFKSWAESLSCNKVLFIAGNHDSALNNLDFMYEHFPKDSKVTYLFNEEYVYISDRVYSIFGTPYCKVFGNWSFMESDEILTKIYSLIPEGLDILITHDVPYGCSDVCLQEISWNTGEHIGNKPLREAILEKKPKTHISGHLHSTSHEWVTLGETRHVNCSLKDENYNLVYEPIEFYE